MKMKMKETRLVKYSGQIFTPPFLVNVILDYAGYHSAAVLRKHVIDNSCGDGAFLCEIVTRYCQAYFDANLSKPELKRDLETYIHGIELDDEAYANCLYNLDHVAAGYGLNDVRWNVIHGNALEITDFNKKMDYVVGNPPYIRVHHLENTYKSVKKFAFAQDGMTDIYLVFFELGLRMLHKKGRLCYITPSSWLSSVAAANMRRHIALNRTLAGLIDLGHFQAFGQVTTYTMISLFDLSVRNASVDYYTYSPSTSDKEFVDTIAYENLFVAGKIYLGRTQDVVKLKHIFSTPCKKYCSVKNGFATLADKVFIQDVAFDKFTIPVLKASTAQWHKGFFPYDKKGRPVGKELLFADEQVREYLERHKPELLKGRTEEQCPGWYLYGRTQALKDVYEDKIAVNTMVKDVDSVKLTEVPAGCGLYSGLYILTKVPCQVICSILRNDRFIAYLRMLKNYKSGGYYTFNSKALEYYLNYKISQYENVRDFVPLDQRGIFEGAYQLF